MSASAARSPGQSAAAEEFRTRRLVLATAVLVNLFGNIGMTGINIGLPAMERELGFSAALLGWVSLSMFMAMAAAAAPGAKLADIYGRRRTTILGLCISIAAMTAGALAWNAASLLASRVACGLGLAVVFTNITAMATSVHPPQMRGRVLGCTIASVYIGLSLGPIICGYLIGFFGWRSIFWLGAVGFIPSLALICLVNFEQRPARGELFDRRGALLWSTAILTLFFGLAHITEISFGPALALVGAIIAVIYVKTSFHTPAPILDMHLFSESRRFAFSSLAAFISYSASTGAALILSLYLQYAKGLSASQAGLILMAQPVCQAVITPFAGRLSDKIDAGLMASTGMSLLCLGLGLLALILTPQTPIYVFICLLMLLGLGFAIFGAPNSNAIIGSAPAERVGQAAGVITATRLCGQVFSIAMTTLVFSQIIGGGRITPDKYPLFMDAATVCFSIFAPVCLLGVLASLARGKKTA